MVGLRDEVDGAAEAAGTVEHRNVALLHLDLGNVGGEEAVEVEAVVGRQVHAHAIHVERNTEAIEAAHLDVALVAAVAALLHGDAGHDAERLVERVLVEGVHRLVGDGGTTDEIELAECVDAHTGGAGAASRAICRRWPLLGCRRGRRAAGRADALLRLLLAGEGLRWSLDDDRRQRRRLFGGDIAA